MICPYFDQSIEVSLRVSALLLVAFALDKPDCSLQAAPPLRPNIVWIMADDLGYGELGCYGQTVIQTPHLDKMAAEALRFSQFYAGATVCAPSRSVLMTGQHHGHTRVRGNAGMQNPAAQALKAEDVTVAKLLQQQGYQTALIGKWGLGDVGVAESGLPNKQGFHEFFGYLNQQHAHNHFPDFLWHNTERVSLPNVITPIGETGAGYATEAKVFADDLFALKSREWVTAHKEGPFFLYWSMVVPHGNNERTRELKNGAQVPDFGPYANEDWPDQDKGHAAMITRLDHHIGAFLDHLTALGIADRTLVIFTSDNGPHHESGHHPERFSPSGAVRGFKRDLTDGGIRVPLIARWPGKIRPGQTTDHVGYFGDFFATAAELAGVQELPKNLDSISFVPALLDKPTEKQKEHQALYWEFHERKFQQAVLWERRWKGIAKADQPFVLYDLHTDLREEHNVASRYPDLAGRLKTWLKTARSNSPEWPIRKP